MSSAAASALRSERDLDNAATVERVRGAELSVAGLSKSFGSQAPILNTINFEVFPGEAVALIGANGAGKSTLLCCCIGLLAIDGGRVRLFGEDLTGARGRELRRLRSQVGFVFQQHNLVPRLSVLTNVVHGALARVGMCGWLQALASRTERERAMHYLDLVGLADFAARRADQLSGGQSQRVAIARALMQQPKMIFADEPVASLDPKAAEEVMQTFVRLLERERLTFVFTSHNLQHALAYAERLLGLRAGAIALDSPSKTQNLASLRQLYDSHVSPS